MSGALRRVTFALSLGVALLAVRPAPAPGLAETPQTQATREGFALATAPYRFRFPRDYGAHFAYASEWWYSTGHLWTRDGRRFGYELTLFRLGLRAGDPRPGPGQSAWRGNQLFPAHFAITDDAGRTFFHTERFAREALGAGFASDRRLDVRVGDWSIAGDGATIRMRAAADADGLDLVQRMLKPPAINGRDGVSRKGACASCASHYYSLTRLQTSGTLRYDGVTYAVRGLSWMDHEYGSGELEPDQAGWDWFALQLDDGRELMLYRLREKNGGTTPESSGTLVARDGRTTYLPLRDFSIEALGAWTSPHTGGRYPSGWRVRVPRAGIDVTVTPTVRDQELADTPGDVSYWEGDVDVAATGSRARRGVGYVELTGYAGAVSL